MGTAKSIVAAIDRDIAALTAHDTPNLRAVRRRYSKAVADERPALVLDVARRINGAGDYRWFGYELIENHGGAFRCLDRRLLEELGRGIDSW